MQRAAYRAESCPGARRQFAGRAQLRGIGQPVQGTLAVGQIGGEVQAAMGLWLNVGMPVVIEKGWLG